MEPACAWVQAQYVDGSVSFQFGLQNYSLRFKSHLKVKLSSTLSWVSGVKRAYPCSDPRKIRSTRRGHDLTPGVLNTTWAFVVCEFLEVCLLFLRWSHTIDGIQHVSLNFMESRQFEGPSSRQCLKEQALPLLGRVLSCTQSSKREPGRRFLKRSCQQTRAGSTGGVSTNFVLCIDALYWCIDLLESKPP